MKIIACALLVMASTMTFSTSAEAADKNFVSTFKIFQSKLPQFFPDAGPSDQINCFLDIYPNMVGGEPVQNDARDEVVSAMEFVDSMYAQGIPEDGLRFQGTRILTDANPSELVPCPFGGDDDGGGDDNGYCPQEDEPVGAFKHGEPWLDVGSGGQICFPEADCVDKFSGTIFTTPEGNLGCHLAVCSNSDGSYKENDVIARGFLNTGSGLYSCMTELQCTNTLLNGTETYLQVLIAPWDEKLCGLPQ